MPTAGPSTRQESFQLPGSPTSIHSSSSISHKRLASAALSDTEDARTSGNLSRGKVKPNVMKMARILKTAALEKRLKKKKSISLAAARALSLKKPPIRNASASSITPTQQVQYPSSAIDVDDSSCDENTMTVQSILATAELERLRRKVKEQDILLDAHKKFLEALSPSVTCQICLDPMLRPFSLAPCGHAACFRCLNEWFRAPPAHIETPPPDQLRHHFDSENPSLLARHSPMLLAKEKACPVCRTAVREAPIESWGLKDIISQLFAHKGNVAKDLYPSYVAPEEVDVSTAEAWKGVFKKPGTVGLVRRNAEGDPGFFDEEDGVFRCRECNHEIWGGNCTHCGRAYVAANPEDDDESAEEIDGGTWMDAHGFDDGLLYRPRFADDEFHEEAEDGIRGVLARARGFIRDHGMADAQRRPNEDMERVPGAYMADEDEQEENDGYESSFIDDDPMEENNYENGHRRPRDNGIQWLNDDDDDDDDDDGALSDDNQRRDRRASNTRTTSPGFARAGSLYRPRQRVSERTIYVSSDEEETSLDERIRNAAIAARRNTITLESESDDGGMSRVNGRRRIIVDDDDGPQRAQRAPRTNLRGALAHFQRWSSGLTGRRNLSSDEESFSYESDHDEPRTRSPRQERRRSAIDYSDDDHDDDDDDGSSVHDWA